jgi:hypothetical protein
MGADFQLAKRANRRSEGLESQTVKKRVDFNMARALKCRFRVFLQGVSSIVVLQRTLMDY